MVKYNIETILYTINVGNGPLQNLISDVRLDRLTMLSQSAVTTACSADLNSNLCPVSQLYFIS
jgi:hypothetical protein